MTRGVEHEAHKRVTERLRDFFAVQRQQFTAGVEELWHRVERRLRGERNDRNEEQHTADRDR